MINVAVTCRSFRLFSMRPSCMITFPVVTARSLKPIRLNKLWPNPFQILRLSVFRYHIVLLRFSRLQSQLKKLPVLLCTLYIFSLFHQCHCLEVVAFHVATWLWNFPGICFSSQKVSSGLGTFSKIREPYSRLNQEIMIWIFVQQHYSQFRWQTLQIKNDV